MNQPTQLICSKCLVSKSFENFHRCKSAKTGRVSKCKDCACAHTREWNAANKDKRSASSKSWAKENTEKINAIRRRHRAKYVDRYREKGRVTQAKRRLSPEYREKNKAYCNQWYYANRDSQLAKGNERYANNREQLLAQMKERYNSKSRDIYKQQRDELSSSYVRSTLYQNSNLSKHDFPEKLVAQKRDQLQLRRLIRELKLATLNPEKTNEP